MVTSRVSAFPSSFSARVFLPEWYECLRLQHQLSGDLVFQDVLFLLGSSLGPAAPLSLISQRGTPTLVAVFWDSGKVVEDAWGEGVRFGGDWHERRVDHSFFF